MNKVTLLVLNAIGTLFVAGLFVLGMNFCFENTMCRSAQDIFNNDNLLVILICPPLFLLSLITYRTKEEVFRAWWNFARWWVPVIILATLGVNLYIAGEGSGADMFDRAFSVWFLGALYGILIFVSLYRIIRTYRALKKR